LCITIAANIAKTGVLAFPACFPDSVVGLTCKEGVVPEFVELVVRSLQAGLEDDAPATAQKNINLETLECLPVPLPPTAEQVAIVEAHAEAAAAGDLLMRAEINTTSATLRQSILSAAFRGELAA
jgi:type I restriction enzyme S subunit